MGPDGTAERDAAAAMLATCIAGTGPVTVGADKNYDTREFVQECREMNVVPHVARNITSIRNNTIDRRTTRHPGYGLSQGIRKRVEEMFGWMKTVGNSRKTRYRGRDRNQLAAYMVAAAHNLFRLSRLLTA